jgi:glycosyltransferase involved in cell wall biosynthesis
VTVARLGRGGSGLVGEARRSKGTVRRTEVRRIIMLNRAPPLVTMGAAKVVWSVGQALARKGWDVHFLTPTSFEPLPDVERIHFHAVPVPDDEDRASALFFLTGLPHFRRLLATVRPHLVYDNCSPIPFVPGYPFCWDRIITRIHHVYGLGVFRYKTGLVNPLATLMGEQWFRVLDGRRVIADSVSTRRALSTMVRHPQHMRIINPGLDLSSLPAYAADSPRDPTLAAVVSRLAPNKGLDVLLRAWRLIEDRDRDVRLVIGGSGRSERDLKALARDLNLRRVEFLGYLSEDQKWDLLRRCVVYPFPTYIEGWGIGILEAMAVGAPVVTTRVPGVVDVVQHGSTGLVVEPGNPRPLAQAIRDLFSDQELRMQLAKNAHEELQRYDLERVTAEEVEYLERHAARLA